MDGWINDCLNCSAGTYGPSTQLSKCIDCPPGRFTALNGSTACETCPLGTEPLSDRGSTCKPIPAGQFGIGTPCPINTYSNEGAVECTDCPSGKYSDISASQCIECDFMYRLSTHCDVPVAGFLLMVSTIIIITVASLLFRRYKKKQDRIKQKLRLDLHRQRQLVKTKQTDINLMTGTTSLSMIRFKFYSQETTTGAWKLSSTEVKLQEKLAQGAYGEVWKGSLHNRWVVAIKKLFPSASSKKFKSSKSMSSKKSSPRNRKRAESKALKDLFKDQEIQFLMRTIYNVQALAHIFLLTQFNTTRYAPRTSRDVSGLWHN